MTCFANSEALPKTKFGPDPHHAKQAQRSEPEIVYKRKRNPILARYANAARA
jgi:hypothetical protein